MDTYRPCRRSRPQRVDIAGRNRPWHPTAHPTDELKPPAFAAAPRHLPGWDFIVFGLFASSAFGVPGLVVSDLYKTDLSWSALARRKAGGGEAVKVHTAAPVIGSRING